MYEGCANELMCWLTVMNPMLQLHLVKWICCLLMWTKSFHYGGGISRYSEDCVTPHPHIPHSSILSVYSVSRQWRLLCGHWCCILEAKGYSGFNWLFVVKWMPLWMLGFRMGKMKEYRSWSLESSLTRQEPHKHIWFLPWILFMHISIRLGKHVCEKKERKTIAGLRCTCKVHDYTRNNFPNSAQVAPWVFVLQQREGDKEEGVQRAASHQPGKSKQQRLSPIRREGKITEHTRSLWIEHTERNHGHVILTHSYFPWNKRQKHRNT